MRLSGAILLVALLCGAAEGKRPLPGDPGWAARSSNEFAVDLYSAVRAEKGNLFFSPYSVSTALAMTTEGARGQTASQMKKVFHWDGGVTPRDHARLGEALRPGTVSERVDGKEIELPAHEMRVANALWAQQGLAVEKPFVTTLDKRFHAPLRRLDFAKTEQARAAINGWVEEQTRERIKDIVPEGLPTADTLLALANAIWFKAAWKQPFDERWTRVAAFTTGPGEAYEVPLMHRTESFCYAEDDAVQVVEIDYRGEETSMVVVLPKKRDGLGAIEAALDAARLDRWIEALAPRRVSVKLPKFETTWSADLAEVLSGMGMPDAFGAKADFTGMVKARPLFIGAVLHKAFVKVDEAGTEAAAATVVMMIKGMPPKVQAEFVADHPFLFLIRHRATGAILFMGRIVDPTES